VELWLIRHGLPLRIDGGDAPADPSLAPEGQEQARLMADWWSRHPIDAIYASPMNRAHETAQPLAAATGHEITLDAGLKEFDSHLNFYVPIEELRADEEAWNRLVAEWLSPEAEEERQRFRAGVVATIDKIVAQHASERVAVVCHGGVINTYVAHVLGLHVGGPGFFYPNYTSINRIVASRSGVRSLLTLNETSFLRGTGLPMGLVQKG
jgi:probable phosphoglycerate mutase